MIKVFLRAAIALILLTITPAFAYEEKSDEMLENDEMLKAYSYKALQFAILNSVGHINPPNDGDALLILLGTVDDDSARKLLAELTGYYIGSAPGEALSYAIQRQGKKILADLTRAIDKPNTCVDYVRYIADTGRRISSAVWCRSLEKRKGRILYEIEAINSGKRLFYVW